MPTLDATYGKRGGPNGTGKPYRNGIKSWELESNAIAKPRSLTTLNKKSADALLQLVDIAKFNLTKPAADSIIFLWVINDKGEMLIAAEELSGNFLANGNAIIRPTQTNLPALGHPCLVDGQPARIGGELNYYDGHWYLTNKSGRYGLGRWPMSESRKYLGNVAALLQKFGIKVICKAS